MKTKAASISISVVLFLVLIGLNHSSHARLVCDIEQLTFDQEQESDNNAISADGTIIAFQSRSDITGENPENNDEMFYYDILEGTFNQISSTTTGTNRTPSLSPNGELITYDYSSSGEAQVFLFNRTTGINTLVAGEPEKNEDPFIDTLGNIITFSSDADIGGGNPGGNEQVFQYNINTGVTTQRTDITVNFIQTTPTNFDGSLVIFSAFGNILGTNPDGNSEIYLIEPDDSLKQLTFGQSGVDSRAEKFGVDSTANLITFLARGDPAGGTGPMGNDQVYFYNLDQDVFTKLTNQPASNNDPAINADGTCIVFSSTQDLTGQNPLNNWQVFIYDLASETFTQVGINLSDGRIITPTPSADCTEIAFSGQPNFESNEAMDEEQVFLARCDVAQVPTISEWGLIALAVVIGTAGFIVLRRRQVSA
ncbi:MAG: IPTL-CTERM sorting domain-containing protein [Thermodesulfobacteriota bacterium]